MLFLCKDSGEIFSHLKHAFDDLESLHKLKDSSYQIIKNNQGACEKLAKLAAEMIRRTD